MKEFIESDPQGLEKNDDGSEYIPIWQVENDLDHLCGNNWSRHSHKYSFHVGHSGEEWLSTSHLLEVNYSGMKRVLLCSSIITLQEYPFNSNLVQTGIAEATKAGVKVIGRRFGKELNDRTISKEKKKKDPIKARPDKSVMNAYMKAVADKDTSKIDQLLSRYDIKIGTDYAKS
jgi:hypothetical protein